MKAMRMTIILAGLFAAAPLVAQTQADMNRAAGQDFARADAAMNAQYRTTMATMRAKDAAATGAALPGPGYRDALLAAQRAWLVWRDAECRVAGYQMRGGSAQPMATAACMARLTQQRTAALRQIAGF